MLTRVFAALALALWAATAMAGDQTERLFAALRVDETIQIMREEGLAYGDQLAQDMLPSGLDPAWSALVSRIYNPEKMALVVRRHFDAVFDSAHADTLIRFFESETGKEIIAAELDARRAFMEPDIEEAARATWRETDKTTARQKAIADYIAANDLIGLNVAGALNANFLFYRGLSEGGGLEMSEEDMLKDVWSQEGETRDDTREWLFAYLTLAYDPLPLGAVRAYADLSLTPAGRTLNRALFAGFDQMYADLSLSLGLAVGSRMIGEEL